MTRQLLSQRSAGSLGARAGPGGETLSGTQPREGLIILDSGIILEKGSGSLHQNFGAPLCQMSAFKLQYEREEEKCAGSRNHFPLIHPLALGGNEEVLEGPGPPSSLSTQRLEPQPLHRPISVCPGPSLMEGTGVQALLLGESYRPPRTTSVGPLGLGSESLARLSTWSPCPFVFTHRYPKASHGPQLCSPRSICVGWGGAIWISSLRSTSLWRGIGGALAAKPSWRGLP